MPNAKYIIEPTPFKMRATSPVNQNGVKGGVLTGDGKTKDYSKEVMNLVSIKPPSYTTNVNALGTLDTVSTAIPNHAVEIADDNKTSVDDDNTSGGDGKKFYDNLAKLKSPKIERNTGRGERVKAKQDRRTTNQGERATKREGNKYTISTGKGGVDTKTKNWFGKRAIKGIKSAFKDSPLNYSIANPFSPSQQDLIGQVYNPSGNDINSFQQNQGANKVTYGQPNPAGNPNTYNQPAIPTEADTTMNDLQMGNAPMGDDLSGGMMPPTGLAPEQGMGSTRGFVPQLSRKERRQQRRSDRRDTRREQGTGLRNFMTRAVTGGMLGYNGPGNEDRQYRRTGTRPFGS